MVVPVVPPEISTVALVSHAPLRVMLLVFDKNGDE